MSEEEERRPRSEFRVVDKRISARRDDPGPTAASAPVSPPQPRSQPVEADPNQEVEASRPPDATGPAAPAGTAPPDASPPDAGDPRGPGTPPGAEEQIWTPEQEAEAQRFMQEIAQRPSLEWVIRAAVELANVAGTKLDLGQVADAQLAIDALAGLVDKLGARFGQAEAPLRQTLAQLQLAFAQRAMATPPAPGAGGS